MRAIDKAVEGKETAIETLTNKTSTPAHRTHLVTKTTAFQKLCQREISHFKIKFLL